MRVVLLGSKKMGCLALEYLAHAPGTEVVGVVGRHDDAPGKQWYPSLNVLAAQNGIPVLAPPDINAPAAVEALAALKPDVLLSVFYPHILTAAPLAVASTIALNLHFAPLPRYRGCYPGAWAIINGEHSHGVTLHQMTPAIDAGMIVGQQMVLIASDETGASLYRKCETAGLELLQREWPKVLDGSAILHTQDGKPLYYDRRPPYGNVVNWAWTARQVDRFVRALTFPPFPNPTTYFRGRAIEVVEVDVVDGLVGLRPGEMWTAHGNVLVATGDGTIKLRAVNDSKGRRVDLVERFGSLDGEVLGW